MVTQEITIFLDNMDPLDPIRMVSGDIGREIRFTVYRRHDVTEPIDLETYSAEVTFIKPDKTFVIEDLDTDQLEIPEQAGAVTGRGYYQIRIYTSGTHQIYSNQGDFIIDDTVLSTEMIESVAEVNGYKFPDDFLTSADLSSYATKDYVVSQCDSLIEDDTTSGIQTWSSSKIADELAAINPETIYSTDEQKIGKWINDSDLYMQTYRIKTDNPPSSFQQDITLTGKHVVKVEKHFANYYYSGVWYYIIGDELDQNNATYLNVKYINNAEGAIRVTSALGSVNKNDLCFTIYYYKD